MNGEDTLTDHCLIAAHAVDYFQQLFSSNPFLLQDFALVEKSIPCLLDDNMNSLLTILPLVYEVSTTVFSLNKDRAPGPGGFGASFFQSFWDVVKVDVCNAVIQFFSTGWSSHQFQL